MQQQQSQSHFFPILVTNLHQMVKPKKVGGARRKRLDALRSQNSLAIPNQQSIWPQSSADNLCETVRKVVITQQYLATRSKSVCGSEKKRWARDGGGDRPSEGTKWYAVSPSLTCKYGIGAATHCAIPRNALQVGRVCTARTQTTQRNTQISR